jgi:hypothetical protein
MTRRGERFFTGYWVRAPGFPSFARQKVMSRKQKVMSRKSLKASFASGWMMPGV